MGGFGIGNCDVDSNSMGEVKDVNNRYNVNNFVFYGCIIFGWIWLRGKPPTSEGDQKK